MAISQPEILNSKNKETKEEIIHDTKSELESLSLELDNGKITAKDLKDYYLDEKAFDEKVSKIAPFWKDKNINLTIANTIFEWKTNFDDWILTVNDNNWWKIYLNDSVEEITKNYIIINRKEENWFVSKYKILNESNENLEITKVEKIEEHTNVVSN